MATKKVKSKKTSKKSKTKVAKRASRPPSKPRSPKLSGKKKTAAKKTKVTKSKPKTTKRKISQEKRFNSTFFPIVGIGASAGGLEAFEDFFAHLDPDTGMAFVVVSHQNPEHTSVLPELLRKCTSMDVKLVTDRLKVKQNTVYLNPPGKNMSILNGSFHITDGFEPRGLSLPIDFFFRSLAQNQGDKAICIILSGTGTDGTLGLRAIKGASGMAIVQEETSAKFSGMPSSALNTGLVDYVLPPDKMPERLTRYAEGPFLSPGLFKLETEDSLDNTMDKIFLQLRNRTGHDFSKYKANTTRRRIERRINVHHMNSSKEYLKYLQDNPQEGDILFKELLIGVTAFFRDVDAYKYLRENLLPEILKTKIQSNILSFRMWVPGCASGEEAYSLAIILDECQKELNTTFEIQIFGTDLDFHAIDNARAGLYPSGIAADISPQRLTTYFSKKDSNYEIKKNIREMVVFAPQNAIKDPPFTKLDFISCRNLLIYLDHDLQQKLLTLFHYSLGTNGILFLGNSESLGESTHLFKPLNKKWKIYNRQLFQPAPLLNKGYFDIPVSKLVKGVYQNPSNPPKGAPLSQTPSVQALTEKHLLSHYAPASVVVNESGGVYYIHGRTGAYLEPAPGKPNLNVLTMARDGLKIDLTTALRQATQQNNPVSIEGIKVLSNGGSILVDLTVQKIIEPDQLRGLYMVVFESQGNDGPAASKKVREAATKTKGVNSDKIESLKKELQYSKENLQSTIEELETTNEELKSTNEELQSTNEELQSSNEEIETSKEEMQSLNEELQTTNAELQAKIDEYSIVNDDMKNLLNSTNIATLFLSNDLKIMRFTPETQKIINLISSDLGRSISDIVSKLDYSELLDDCSRVIKTLVHKEREVRTKEGHWYRLRIFPYRTTDNKIIGLVVTFIDINDLKRAEGELAKTGQLKLVTDALPIKIAYVTMDLKYKLANKAYQTSHGSTGEFLIGKSMQEVLGIVRFKTLRKHIDQALQGEKVSFESDLLTPEGEKKKQDTQLIPHFENKKVVGIFIVAS